MRISGEFHGDLYSMFFFLNMGLIEMTMGE
jgi:hypothetical protein